MPATLKSRLPFIAAELRPRVSAAVKAGAELVAERAKARAPDAPPQGEGLVEAIHVERTGAGEYSVMAGDDDVFWARFVEFGTQASEKHRATAPHPFLLPAAEESKDEIAGLITVVLRSL